MWRLWRYRSASFSDMAARSSLVARSHALDLLSPFERMPHPSSSARNSSRVLTVFPSLVSKGMSSFSPLRRPT